MFGRKEVSIPADYQQFNTFPTERERLLCIGASTTECKHKIETKLDGSNKMLKLYYPKNRGAKVMKYWLPMFGINDSRSAVEIISTWIEGNDYYGEVPQNVTSTVINDIAKASRKKDFNKDSLVSSAEKIKTFGAFDLERLGYLVRVCFSLDLLTEEQSWEFLNKFWEDAVLHFENWDDYIVSYLNGQEGMGTNWYSDTLVSYIQLKKDPNSLLNQYQLR
ncbi:DUF1266 domain-containing protein [Listeria sp. FSL L7-0091]|uniref:DUF1266 domain-containing protein n=1 Tax=Listeria farberi TaxID=2713500 RepID=A0A7X0ZIY9_9LIST|nr:DUF1266 domain-containing protein [Listeria farberi]MBC2262453.1 DUF1266 domain-containing protein [Listeria farberi]MBC2266227.1 DUF1266 domain-containing protein [Listeria farberi]MBC2288115.1 DUF1266 domain-containing protein [Listeria farberi]